MLQVDIDVWRNVLVVRLFHITVAFDLSQAAYLFPLCSSD
jgi:hypothetical protein